MSKCKEKQKGITLIALVITIIVLLILAGVTIAMLTGENGILTQAKRAKTTTELAEIKERVRTDVLGWQAGNNGEKINGTELKTILEKYFNEVPEDYGKDTEITAKNEYGGQVMKVSDVYDGEIKGIKSKVSKETSYVGCYADIEGDGIVDGIIYADLAIGGSGEWAWTDTEGAYEVSRGTYEIPKETERLKDYCISQTNYKVNDGFGTNDVISPTGTGGDKDRFYIMALEDFNKGTEYYWYNVAGDTGMEDYSSITSTGFGAGKTNTATMISKWKDNAYGKQNEYDIWGKIQEKVNKGWFVPSEEEWIAFAGELGITNDRLSIKNYWNYDLKINYWTSSMCDSKSAYCMYFWCGSMGNCSFGGSRSTRLSATF